MRVLSAAFQGLFKVQQLSYAHKTNPIDERTDYITTARHEYKINISYSDYLILRTRLAAVLERDANADANGEYRIRSLYFDTPADRALREKIDGLEHREKYRIRMYGEDTSSLKLEKKSKHHGLCYKQSVPITARETELIIEGDIGWMPRDTRPLIVELYSKMSGQLLRPKCIVDYIREPFVCSAGNVRVTLDRGIRTALQSTDILDMHLPTVPADGGQIILEVKYDEFLPSHIAGLVDIGNRRSSAYSKYAAGRIYG